MPRKIRLMKTFMKKKKKKKESFVRVLCLYCQDMTSYWL